MEIGCNKRFKKFQLQTIRDHARIVKEPDEFIHWIQGVMDMAWVFGKATSVTFYNIVKDRLDEFFDKHTPERNPEIQKACDGVMDNKLNPDFPKAKVEIDSDNLKRMVEDFEKGLLPHRVTLPFIEGQQPARIEGYVSHQCPPTVYCGGAGRQI